MKSISNGTLKIALAVALITLIVYLQALTCGFVLWDDPDYILYNTAIRHLDWNLLVAAFTKPTVSFWMPLTSISFAIDYRFWGLEPIGYHLTNILLHAINSFLVVLIADRLFWKRLEEYAPSEHQHLRPGMLLLAGLLFGIHPLRVESVAWVTERKDVLNGLFSLGAILCYLRYAQVKEGVEKGNATRAYLFSLVLFILSLMAKSVSVVLPAMLLVADWYPLGRMRKGKLLRIMAEKVPYLIIAAAMTFVTIIMADDIMVPGSELSYGLRGIIAGNGLFEYGRLLLWPVGILPFYVLPKTIPYVFAVKTAAAAVFSCYCIYLGRKRHWVLATWLAFVLPLLPVLGFTQNGEQAFAARFTYLPAVFPSIVAAAAITMAFTKARRTTNRYVPYLVVVPLAFLLLFYAGTTLRLINVWKNTGTLWSRVIDGQPIGRAYKDRGAYYLTTGNYPAAIYDLTTAIDIATNAGLLDIYNVYALRGDALSHAGRYEEAVNDFNVAIAMSPRPVYFYHRGLALKAWGRLKEANNDFERAGNERGAIDW